MLKREVTYSTDIDDGDESSQCMFSEDSDVERPSKKKKNFFRTLQVSKKAELDEVHRYIIEGPASTNSILQYPSLIPLYRKYNTALPASASVERLFSSGGRIFSPCRNRLNDAKFEELLFLKVNDNLNLI